MTASGSEPAPQLPKHERKNNRLDLQPAAREIPPPGSTLDENPGSTLSRNQQAGLSASISARIWRRSSQAKMRLSRAERGRPLCFSSPLPVRETRADKDQRPPTACEELESGLDFEPGIARYRNQILKWPPAVRQAPLKYCGDAAAFAGTKARRSVALEFCTAGHDADGTE